MERKIRFGIIGTNFITEEFVSSAGLCEEIELAAVYSRTEERGREFAERFGFEHVFTDLETLLKSDVVDAMYIASPNALHAGQAILCLNHKKHVLCEKPMASNSREVNLMMEAAKANGVLLMEAMKPTYFPNLHVIKDNLHKIGTVRRYFGSYCQYSSRYDAYREGTILNAFKPDLSNGALVDIGIYPIAVMLFLFGVPESVKASAYLLESGVDGEGSLNFKYEGMEANVIYSKITNSYLPSEIQGEDGNIIIDHITQMNSVQIQYRNGEIEELTVPQSEIKMFYELRGFIDAILNNQLETEINSHQFSKDLIALLDKVRSQIGVVFPADKDDIDA